MSSISNDVVYKFLAKRDYQGTCLFDPEPCWLWSGCRDKDGYGRLTLHGRGIIAARLAWEIANGPIPDGMLVCHHCDNPPCVRVHHLFLGTYRDNCIDMISKGRGSATGGTNLPILHGTDNPASVLTEADVIKMRLLHANGSSFKSLAEQFAVGTVHSAVTGKTWRHVK